MLLFLVNNMVVLLVSLLNIKRCLTHVKHRLQVGYKLRMVVTPPCERYSYSTSRLYKSLRVICRVMNHCLVFISARKDTLFFAYMQIKIPKSLKNAQNYLYNPIFYRTFAAKMYLCQRG